jgi:hypothetical protein
MNYNGFKSSSPQPQRAAGPPVGEAMFPTRSGDCSHDGRTPFIGSR